MLILKIFTNVNNLNDNKITKANKIGNLIMGYATFLNGFSYDKFIEKNGMNLWIFTHKFPDYTFRVIFCEKDNQWKSKIFVYWKHKTETPTLGAGKDFEHKIGPYDDFQDLIKNMNKMLENNPIMGKHLYHDDFELNMDKEALPLLVKLKQSGEQLLSIEDVYFEDLKKIYKNIKDIPEEKFIDYCRVKNQREADKQDFLLDLQKVHKLDFYSSMKNMGHMY